MVGRGPRLIVALALVAATPSIATQRVGLLAQERREAGTPEDVQAAIDRLGSLEFPIRTGASRTVRRAAPAVAVPALTRAVSSHADGYVRFRALVLLSGFNDPKTRDLMIAALQDKNDRLRTVAYTWFEHHPDPQVLPRLLEALEREESEFVRPALTRAVIAHTGDAKARAAAVALVQRGENFFRSVAIEAAGAHKAAHALPALMQIAGLDGPLQDDAVLALGRIGDKKALEGIVKLQRTAPRELQPVVAAGICLLGVNCGAHLGYLVKTLEFGIANHGYQELLRASATALAALAVAGNEEAAVTLVEKGAPTRDPARAAIALAVGTVALRNTALLLKIAEDPARLDSTVELLREAFDMLEEDFEEERFFVAVRRAYWQAAEGSPARRTAETLIGKLEF